MRNVDHMSLTPRARNLKIIYGNEAFVREKLDAELPLIASAYPNPAKDEITIPFRVPNQFDQLPVEIKIYNSNGLEITTLVNEQISKGSHEVKWHPFNATGLYLIRIKVGSFNTQYVKVCIE